METNEVIMVKGIIFSQKHVLDINRKTRQKIWTIYQLINKNLKQQTNNEWLEIWNQAKQTNLKKLSTNYAESSNKICSRSMQHRGTYPTIK